MVRLITVFVLSLGLVLSGCSSKVVVDENEKDRQDVTGSATAELTGSSEATSSITNGEEAEMQNSTKPLEVPTESNVSTNSGEEDNDALTDGAATTNPENKDDNMPDYGIELPDDNWN